MPIQLMCPPPAAAVAVICAFDFSNLSTALVFYRQHALESQLQVTLVFFVEDSPRENSISR